MKTIEKVSRLFLVMLLMSLVMTACKKDKEKPKSREELLGGKKWKLTAFTANPAVNGTTDVYATLLEACETDDLYEFRTGGILVIEEGPTQCSPTDPTSRQGSWSLSADKAKLTVLVEDDNTVLDIIELTETTLVGQYTEGLYTFRVTYQRQ